MSDDHSTNTAVQQEQAKDEVYPPQPAFQTGYNGLPYNYDGQLHPPRTGLLRISYYKRTGTGRVYPTSCAAGLALVATTLFSLGLIISGARHVPSAAIMTSSLFLSGLVQVICGIWSIVDDNLFASTFFLCYGGFFMSLGGIESDVFGIDAAYADGGLTDALGIYLASWTVFTFFLWTATFKSTVPLFVLMFCLWMFFLLYTIAIFGSHKGCETAAGVFCFITAVCAFYAFYDGLSFASNSYAPLPEAKWLRMPASWNPPADENKVEYV